MARLAHTLRKNQRGLLSRAGFMIASSPTFQSGAPAFELSFAQRRMETSSWMPATETPIGRFAVGARYGHGAGFRSSTRHRGARSRRYDFCDHLGIRGGREAPAHRHFFDDPTSMRAAEEAETGAGHS
jgi:hypothetical protein